MTAVTASNRLLDKTSPRREQGMVADLRKLPKLRHHRRRPILPADTNTYMSNYNYIPYVQAPNTSHVAWKRQSAIAGIICGTAGQYSASGSVGAPSVIYAGRCYQTMTVPINGVPTSCALCYDLRTGEQYYAIPVSQGGVTPQKISYTRGTAVAVAGATE